MRRMVVASLLAALVSTVALAYEIHHPNLREAHRAAEMAIHHIQNAQRANQGVEFGGHAKKAIDLLRRAQEELAEADKWNDAHHR
jgi:hypothetical protein